MRETDTGVIVLHGRPVIVQRLHPSYIALMGGEENFPYKYVVVEIGRIEDKTAWLWDGVADV